MALRRYDVFANTDMPPSFYFTPVDVEVITFCIVQTIETDKKLKKYFRKRVNIHSDNKVAITYKQLAKLLAEFIYFHVAVSQNRINKRHLITSEREAVTTLYGFALKSRQFNRFLKKTESNLLCCNFSFNHVDIIMKSLKVLQENVYLEDLSKDDTWWVQLCLRFTQ